MEFFLKTVGTNVSVIFTLASSAAEEPGEPAEQRLCDCYTSCAATMLGLSSISPHQLLDVVKASTDVSLSGSVQLPYWNERVEGGLVSHNVT